MRDCSSCFRGSDVENESRDENVAPSVSNPICLRDHSQTKFYCCGSPDRLGSHWKRHGMFDEYEGRSVSSLDLGVDALSQLDAVKYHNIELPYINSLPVTLHLGSTIVIQGKTFPYCNRFTVNLSTGRDVDSDFGLHLNPRFDRRFIVRNHRIRNKWGPEEIASVHPFPFRVGRNFSILILIADEQFMISVNKNHFCAFAFRTPLQSLKFIIITGEIEVQSLEFSSCFSYPPLLYKKKPYVVVPKTLEKTTLKCEIRRKVKELSTGSKVEIFGRVRLLPRGFYINLQKGLELWPHPIIPFHMNLRFYRPGAKRNEQEIIFNSWNNGMWGKEQSVSFCPFMPGTEFHIVIESRPDVYRVEVNNEFLYGYHKKEYQPVDSVVIHGDVFINKVILRRMGEISLEPEDNVKKKRRKSSSNR